MANPVFINCLAGVWTKIATNVTTGFVHKVFVTPLEYLQTYRETGDAAPTLKSEGVPLFRDGISEEILTVSAIDIYVWCINDAGKVRVDL